MGKYLNPPNPDALNHAETAFGRALELNPDLPLAHKLYAQLDVDLGRARNAMERLLGRARSADSELFAGLVSACRYCGLLEASIAADARARTLEPRIRTSVLHSHFLHGDHAKVAAAKLEEFPYIGAISLAEMGRKNDAIAALVELEQRTKTRLREFMIAARTLLEGKTAESLAAVNRVLSSDFSDPEGLFYLTRHLARLNDADGALEVLRRVVSGGFSCYPAMEHEWLDPLKKKKDFKELLETVRGRHEAAAAIFTNRRGPALLGMS